MKAGIERALSLLIGMRLADAGRASAADWFHFAGHGGEQPPQEGRAAMAYALHAQCAWRITRRTIILVGSDDRYVAAGGDPFKGYGDFDWDRPGANRCDERIEALLAGYRDTPLTVMAVEADELGSLRMQLSDDVMLSLVPVSSLPGEHWRFFRVGSAAASAHFVVTGDGIDN